MPPDDTHAAGVREIEVLRARIAHIEDLARQPRSDLGAAIGAAMTQPPMDHKTRALRNAAHFYDPTQEVSFRQGMGDPLAQAIANAGRDAFVKLGGKIPDPEED